MVYKQLSNEDIPLSLRIKEPEMPLYVRGNLRVKLNTFACFSMKTYSMGTHYYSYLALHVP